MENNIIPYATGNTIVSFMVERVINLETKTREYFEGNGIVYNTNTVNHYVLGYIRTRNPGYTGLEWDVVGGPMSPEYVTYINNAYPTYDTFFRDEMGMYLRDPVSGDHVDMRHMCATIDGYISASNPTPDSWSGWAGDAADLTVEIQHMLSNSQDYDYFLQTAIEMMGGNSRMSNQDILADVDGANIAGMLKSDSSMYFSTALSLYYGGRVNTRYSRFINSFGAWYDFEGEVYQVLDPANVLKGGILLTAIMSRKTNKNNHPDDPDYPTPSRDQFHAVAGAFVNHIFTRANLEGYTYD